VIVALLGALGIPFLSAKWGLPDDRVLPVSASSRQVGDQLRTDFAGDPATNVTVVIPDVSGITPADLDDYAAQLSRVADVESVSSPAGAFVAGARVGPPSAATALRDGSAFLTVTSSAPLYSQASQTQLDGLQAVPGPGGRHPLLTGSAPSNSDTAHAVTSRLPIVLAIIAAITFVLLFSGMVLTEAILAFLGIGLDNSWGQMIDQARDELSRDPIIWWNLTAASTALFGLILAVNLVGDAVRDVLDPRTLRERA